MEIRTQVSGISPADLSRLALITDKALGLVLGLVDDEERTGGYLSVFSRSNTGPVPGAPDALFAAGIISDPGKRVKYSKLSREKCVRLYTNRALSHVSSWQTRNPSSNMWGGAILAGDYYIGFSGLPELADEALVIIVSLAMGWIDQYTAWEIAVVSDNRFVLDHKPEVMSLVGQIK